MVCLTVDSSAQPDNSVKVTGRHEPSREQGRELFLPSERLDLNAGLGHFTGIALAPFAKTPGDLAVA
jgi:hypothetical protein